MLRFFTLRFLALVAVFLFLGVQAGTIHQVTVMALPGEPCTSTDYIWDVAFSPDERYLLVSNWQSQEGEAWKARMWEVATGDVALDFDYSDVLPSNAAYHSRVDFSPDGKYVVTASSKQALIWDAHSGTLLHQIMLDMRVSETLTAEFTTDGQYVVIGGDGVVVWEVATGQEVRSFPGLTDPQRHQYVDVSNDMNYIITHNLNKAEVYLSNFQTGDLHFIFDQTYNAMFSPDSKYIVTAGRQGIKLWDTQTLQVKHILDTNYSSSNGWQFSPDSRYLLTGAWRVWEVESGVLLAEFPPTGYILIHSFLPDSQHLLLPDLEAEPAYRTIGVWELPSRTKVHTFSLEVGGVVSYAFTQGSRFVAIGTNQGHVQLWDIWNGVKVRSFC